MNLRSRISSLAMLIMLTTPIHAEAQTLPVATPESVGLSTERLARLEARIEEYIADELIAGAVTLVARHGEIVHLESHGYRDREAGDPMDTDDIFIIMSMTKPIVSTALMMLYEEGRFLLTDPVARWLPEFSEMKVRVARDGEEETLVDARPITVRHVLTHTAGLPPTTARLPDVEPVPGDSPLRARVRQFAAVPLNFQPGDRWEYGWATDVVAALVEEISGQNLDEFLRTRIFEPLGMHDTHYNVPPEKWGRRARLYSPDPTNEYRIVPRPVTEPTPTQLFGGVAGLSSTAADYFRFAQMVMNGGELDGVRILSPKTVDLMITNHIGDLEGTLKGPGYGFGLGYSVLMDPGRASEPLTPGSYGWGGMYGTYYINDPVESLVGILMIQISSYRHLNIRAEMASLLTQAIVEPNRDDAGRIRGYEPLR